MVEISHIGTDLKHNSQRRAVRFRATLNQSGQSEQHRHRHSTHEHVPQLDRSIARESGEHGQDPSSPVRTTEPAPTGSDARKHRQSTRMPRHSSQHR
ncbi:hypothetical protein ACWDKQ_19770 [Saccharopolyspora sp. NPDC000995]